jgi:OPA family sugar phosphate sensor protein UhpC-like MFS transporter
LAEVGAAQDLGGKRGSGSAAGIINGLGSLGAILEGGLTWVTTNYLGWNNLFYVLMLLAFLATGILMPLVMRDLHKGSPA